MVYDSGMAAEVLSARVTPEMARHAEGRAAEMGVTTSAWVRALIAQALNVADDVRRWTPQDQGPAQ